jgi:hypothetical protein
VERAGVSKMLKKLFLFLAFGPLFLVASAMWAQETPAEVSICELAKHPKSFDGKGIRVRGTLSVYFEDFSLVVRNCDSQQGIWLAFGGDVPGIVASMVNDTVRKPGVDLKVNGVSYGIKKDENFRRLYALIAARHGRKPAYRVTATLTGAFFAGEESKLANGQTVFAGYGHLGCCALLVITQVSDVESVPPANLNVHGTVLGPDSKPVERFVVFDDVLGGSPPERQHTATNGKGKFEFSNSGQLLRFENPSYRPLALSVEPGGSHMNVRLEDAKRSDWLVPACGQVRDSTSQIGFSFLFALPTTMESSLSNEEDSHSYFVFPRGREPFAAEFFISSGADETEESKVFVDSEWSEQRWIKSSAGTVVGIDSRGRLKGGGHWRTAFFLGHETARYSLHPGKQHSEFDRIIDSACMIKR